MLASLQMVDLTPADENKLCKRLLRDDRIGPSGRPLAQIPRSIVQFWDQRSVPADVMACMRSWSHLTEIGYTYEIYDDSAAREFIEAHYSSIYLDAYLKCYHPAMRCDYFRMTYLLAKGGIYSDADNVLVSMRGLDDLLTSGAALYLSPLFHDKSGDQPIMMDERLALASLEEDHVYAYFNNDPLICERGCPIVRLALDRATQLIIQNSQAGIVSNIHGVTGPSNITYAISAYFNYWQTIDFKTIYKWQEMVSTVSDLEYKYTDRNWRTERPVVSG